MSEIPKIVKAFNTDVTTKAYFIWKDTKNPNCEENYYQALRITLEKAIYPIKDQKHKRMYQDMIQKGVVKEDELKLDFLQLFLNHKIDYDLHILDILAFFYDRTTILNNCGTILIEMLNLWPLRSLAKIQGKYTPQNIINEYQKAFKSLDSNDQLNINYQSDDPFMINTKVFYNNVISKLRILRRHLGVTLDDMISLVTYDGQIMIQNISDPLDPNLVRNLLDLATK